MRLLKRPHSALFLPCSDIFQFIQLISSYHPDLHVWQPWYTFNKYASALFLQLIVRHCLRTRYTSRNPLRCDSSEKWWGNAWQGWAEGACIGILSLPWNSDSWLLHCQYIPSSSPISNISPLCSSVPMSSILIWLTALLPTSH